MSSQTLTTGESALPTLKSPLLEAIPMVRHGFSTRRGGVSPGPFASLNLGMNTADDPKRVAANRGRLARSLGSGFLDLVCATQIHSDDIVQIRAGETIEREADALWSKHSGVAVGITVADCVPLLFADTRGAAVAAVHAGWRGTHKKIGPKMVGQFREAGIPLEAIRVALGPAIGPCCFSIGEDVVEKFHEQFDWAQLAISKSTNHGWTADLWEINRRSLMDSGVRDIHIDTLRHCTFCDSRFFSYRRDRGNTGRQAGVIGIANPGDQGSQ